MIGQSMSPLKLYDCCKTHCRDFSETLGGTIPPSEHSPGCVNYILERFTKIRYPSGSFCVVDDGDSLEFDDYTTRDDIWITRDQFDRMDEFTGP